VSSTKGKEAKREKQKENSGWYQPMRSMFWW
jgi:hypothetical protein